MHAFLSYFIWDPKPGMFDYNLPLLNRPLLWYGFFFALGFFLAYRILVFLLRPFFSGLNRGKTSLKQVIGKFSEQLTFYVILGTLIGARLGDLLFYQNWSFILDSPLSIFAIWEGGLASHGGAIGILGALLIFSKRNKMPFFRVVDFVVIPTMVAAVFIRIGNFFNQEILGIPTSLPWGVIFLHPIDASAIVPRHPVQLYESFGYLCIFFILLGFWRQDLRFSKIGRLTGIFLVFVFSFRFLIEFLKMEQSTLLVSSWLTMGQWLSLPFILLGIFLLIRNVSSKA